MNDTNKILTLLKALTDAKDNIVVITVPGNPPTKSRPKFRKGGGAYNTPQTKALERKTACAIKACIKEPYLANVAMVCIFYRGNKQRCDADNMLKHVCDAANGVAWVDDSQVTAITGIIELDVDNPRTILACAPHATTMHRCPSVAKSN